MTFGEMKSALARRGFDYLETADLARFVTEAADELNQAELWPWRRWTVTAAAGNTMLPVFGPVDYVKLVGDQGRTLHPVRASEAADPALTSPSSTGVYYVAQDNVQVRAGTGAFLAAYFDRRPWGTIGSFAAAPANDSDTGVIPARWHEVLLRLAIARAKEFNDALDEAQALRNTAWGPSGDLDRMRDAELVPGWDEPDVVLVHGDPH